MKAGYLQFAPEFGNVRANVLRVREMLDDVSADLVVLPELFNTGYYFTDFKEVSQLAEKIPDGFTVQNLTEVCKEWRIHIVAGILEEDNGLFYNSAVLIGEQGYIDHYRKIHLFNEEKLYFAPGDKPFKVYDIGKAKIGIMICYDWIYPESVRILSLMGADVICHPANLVMPYCPKVMPSRCFENKVFAITANRYGMDYKDGKALSFIGLSQIIAPDGKVVKRAPAEGDKVDIVFMDVKQARDKKLNEYNNLFEDRRPEMYEVLTKSREELAELEPVNAITHREFDGTNFV